MSRFIDNNSLQLENPFHVESPEKLSPRQVVELFISDYTRIETVKQRKHTFIWGSRGSGKSMMFRFLEPQCQSIFYGGYEEYLSRSDAFLAIYCPIKEGALKKTELLLLDDYQRLIIVEHMMNMFVAYRTMDSLRTQIPQERISHDQCTQFAWQVAQLFDRASIAPSIQEANTRVKIEDSPMLWLQILFDNEIRKINSFLHTKAMYKTEAVYEGATSGYHDFLMPLMRLVQSIMMNGSLPVYVLLDDAGKLTDNQEKLLLTKNQQCIINSWVANRDQATLCLKVSAERAAYKTYSTRDGALIEEPHDYSSIDVDELYTKSKTNYFEKVKLIANRRLELSLVPTKDITEFLPPNKEEELLLAEFKKQTREEWHTAKEPGRQNDYVTRYATARLFQHLRKTKKRKSYAGFGNIVDLSSGVIRAFLEPCYLMFDECKSSGTDIPSISHIPSNIQDDVLFRYAEELVLKKFDEIREGLPPEKWTLVDALATLIASLGQLFYERLHDPDAREARLFSFTVRGRVPDDIDQVLQLGVRYRYFQLRTYSTKEGGGREKWYILNRRLCPVYKLDPSGFEGRISLTAEALRLACENPQKFVRMRLKQNINQSSDHEHPTLFVLEEETDDAN
ncbi:MAG: hypothetical protein ABFD46_02825 [Armatimonadota bacterium]